MAKGRDLVASVRRRWLRQIVASFQSRGPSYKKLFVFDFDGTLFRSPHPPSDEKEEMWWANPESLSKEMVGDPPSEEMWHPDSVHRMKEAIQDPEAYVVVMTGRHSPLQGRLKEILDSAGLKPDELITNPEIGNTNRYKQDEMKYLAQGMPRLQEIEFWEDKKEDLKSYKRTAEKLGFRFVPRLVKNYEDKPPPYLGLFLDPKTKEQLLKDFPPKHPEVQADHITLVFKPTPEQTEALKKEFGLGKRFPLKVTGVIGDTKAQAVQVELPQELGSFLKDKTPHITLSVAEGVSPAHSNKLFESGKTTPVPPKEYLAYLDAGPRPGSPEAKSFAQETKAKKPQKQTQKQKFWKEFLQTETRNPNYGKPGHHKERVLRKTLYETGGSARNQVMREWGPYLQGRRER